MPALDKGGRAPERRYLLGSLAFGLLWLFVLTIPLENALVIPGIGTLGRMVGLAAFGMALLALLDAGKLRPFSAAHVMMAVYVVWAIATYFWSQAPEDTLEKILSYIQLLAMVWLIWELAPQQNDRARLMQAYLIGASIVAIGIMLSHGPADQSRHTAFNMNPNDVGLRLAMSVPMALYLAVTEGKGFRVWLYGLQTVLAACALFLTASRGSVLALLASVLMIPLTFRKWSLGQKVCAAVLLVIGAFAAIAVVPPSAWERLGSTQGEITQGTMNDRKDIWKAGAQTFRDHPFVGVGLGAFGASVQSQTGMALVAHNTYLSVLVEQGVIGFGIFALLLTVLARTASKMPVLERSLWLVMLLTWAVGVAGMTWEDYKPTWFLFGMVPIEISVLKAALDRSSSKRAFGLRSMVQPLQPARQSLERTKLLRELRLKLRRAGLEESQPERTYEPR